MNRYYKLVDKIPVAVPDIQEWAKSFEDGSRIVKRTHIGKVFVSTVFLIINHNFWEGGDPILFETMIFGGKLDQYQERYCTYDQALAGHIKACNKVRKETYNKPINKTKTTLNTKKEWKKIMKK